MRDLPWLAKQWVWLMVLLAALLGGGIDLYFGTKIDYWIHDEALVIQERTDWKHTAIVTLDDAIPTYVSRQQAVSLFARAADILADAGVKGLFLDARLSKEIETKMPYALCVEPSLHISWSMPETTPIGQNQCQLNSSPKGNAPLEMSKAALDIFKIAPYQAGQEAQSDDLLYGDAVEHIPASGLVREIGLIKKDGQSAIKRWIELSEQHAVIEMAKFINPQQVVRALADEAYELCEKKLPCDDNNSNTCTQQRPCRRIRFSRPLLDHYSDAKPILPISKMAACDDRTARQIAAQLKGRVVIFQLTTPTEMTDVHIIPTTTALLGSHLLIPGSQYLGDAIETILANDHPQAPPLFLKLWLFLFAAALGVLGSVYLKQPSWLWLIGALYVLCISALCFVLPIMQLWPVTATTCAFVIGAFEGIALHLMIGSKETRLIAQYMPQQVHDLLLPLKINQNFLDQRYQAIVLMSDLSGYTTVTGILKAPTLLLKLMNAYLTETSFVLQDRYQGWLESYIGDMVCYYWPYQADNKTQYFENALKGAIALSRLQKKFFDKLPEQYQNQFDHATLHKISNVIDAGIGISAGEVVMGDLGPTKGVRKFGILGDPMNLTARIESLTRFFDTEIIVTAQFLTTAKTLGYPVRRLGCYRVKGRDEAETLYALGSPDDLRFQPERITIWEDWLLAEERDGRVNLQRCAGIFQLDRDNMSAWKRRGLLKNGVWSLDLK